MPPLEKQLMLKEWGQLARMRRRRAPISTASLRELRWCFRVQTLHALHILVQNSKSKTIQSPNLKRHRWAIVIGRLASRQFSLKKQLWSLKPMVQILIECLTWCLGMFRVVQRESDRCKRVSPRWDRWNRLKGSIQDKHKVIVEQTLQVLLASEVEGEHKPDVSINISSSDLAGVLKVGMVDDWIQPILSTMAIIVIITYCHWYVWSKFLLVA